jgi:hypothetical protein
VAYRTSTILSTKFKPRSRLNVRCHRGRIWSTSHGQTWLEGRADHKERNRIARSPWKLNGAHHGVRPLVEIQILHFSSHFLIFFLIMYHLNRKHTNFQLNWTDGVAYRNSTIFSIKFNAPSRLWVRCLRIRIGASSYGYSWLGRHSRSQRKKKHNTIGTKAQRSSQRGQATTRNPNFALFALIFLIFFLFSTTQIGSSRTFSSIGQKVWPIEIIQLLAWNLKHHPGSVVGAVQVKFVPLAVGKPD